MLQLDEHTFYTTWEDVRELRRMIELDGVPTDPDDLYYKFIQAVRNAEGLHLAFGNNWDAASRAECYALAAAIREAVRWKTRPTHTAPRTLN